MKTATKKNFEEIVMEKRAMMEAVEKLIAALDDLENDKIRDYKVIGKAETQSRSWKTDELYWVDENGSRTTENTGTPYYDDKYGYVDKEESELTEQDKAFQRVIDGLKETLVSLI